MHGALQICQEHLVVSLVGKAQVSTAVSYEIRAVQVGLASYRLEE